MLSIGALLVLSARAAGVRYAPSCLVKPSPTSTPPRLVLGLIMARVVAGIEISTEDTPVLIITCPLRRNVPSKLSLYDAAPPSRRKAVKLAFPRLDISLPLA